MVELLNMASLTVQDESDGLPDVFRDGEVFSASCTPCKRTTVNLNSDLSTSCKSFKDWPLVG